eukprot:35092-Amphidinium_carterae.1
MSIGQPVACTKLIGPYATSLPNSHEFKLKAVQKNWAAERVRLCKLWLALSNLGDYHQLTGFG